MTKFFFHALIALSLTPLCSGQRWIPSAQARESLAQRTVSQKQAELKAELRAAYEIQDYDQIKDLLAQGADLKLLALSPQNSLLLNARIGHLDNVKQALREGAQINPGGDSSLPLFAAAASNSPELLKYLVNQGADLKTTDQLLTTPLLVAAREGALASVRFFVTHGADINAANIFGETPLIAAAGSSSDHLLDMLQYLVNHGADVNARRNNGETVVSSLSQYDTNIAAALKYLVSQGARFNTLDESGETILSHRIRANDLDTVKFLLAQGANITQAVNAKQDTVLILAARHASLNMLTYLINQKANVNQANRAGLTPLHAVDLYSSGIDEVPLQKVKYLIAQGADVNAISARGETPLVIAAEWGAIAVMKYLIAHGADVNAAHAPRKLSPLEAFYTYLILESIPSEAPEWQFIDWLVAHGADASVLPVHQQISPDQEREAQAAADERLYTAFLNAEIEEIQRAREELSFAHLLQRAELKVPENALMLAAGLGEMEQVRTLLKQGVNINARNASGHHALTFALRGHALQVARYLVTQGANVNLRTDIGTSPLDMAVDQSETDLVRFLLQHGARIESPSNSTPSPLMEAISQGDLELVKVLIEGGANVDAEDEYGTTPLLHAVELDDLELVKYLVERETDPRRLRDFDYAVYRTFPRNDALFFYLLDQGADPNGHPAMHSLISWAIESHNNERFQFLLKRQVDLNRSGKDGVTPLMLAIYHNAPEMVSALLQHGARVNLVDQNGQSALLYAATRGALEQVKRLIKYGASLQARDQRGNDVLLNAAHSGSLPLVKYLITQHKLPITVKNDEGLTLLMAAAGSGNLELVKYLVEVQQLRLTARGPQGRPALFYAVHSAAPDLIAYFIHTLKADPRATDDTGQTVLMQLPVFEQLEADIMHYLIAHGAPPLARDNAGYTALSYAKSAEAIQLLVEQGADVNEKDPTGKTPLLRMIPGGADPVDMKLLDYTLVSWCRYREYRRSGHDAFNADGRQ